ncbi:MAG: hypothetical protein AAF968_00230 [Pseudomonadota bacterium]
MSPAVSASTTLDDLGLDPLDFMRDSQRCLAALSRLPPDRIRACASASEDDADHAPLLPRPPALPDPAAVALADVAARLQQQSVHLTLPEQWLRLRRCCEDTSTFPLLLIETARRLCRADPHRAPTLQRRVIAALEQPRFARVADPAALRLATLLAKIDGEIARAIAHRLRSPERARSRISQQVLTEATEVRGYAVADRAAISLRMAQLVEQSVGTYEALRIVWAALEGGRPAGVDVEIRCTLWHEAGRYLVQLKDGRRARAALYCAERAARYLPRSLAQHSAQLAHHQMAAERILQPTQRLRPIPAYAEDDVLRGSFERRLAIARHARLVGQSLIFHEPNQAVEQLAACLRTFIELNQPWEAVATLADIGQLAPLRGQTIPDFAQYVRACLTMPPIRTALMRTILGRLENPRLSPKERDGLLAIRSAAIQICSSGGPG